MDLITKITISIPISKYSDERINEERVINSIMTVEALRLVLRFNFLSIFDVFKHLVTKITISIPEKSSVAIALKKVKASSEPVHF